MEAFSEKRNFFVQFSTICPLFFREKSGLFPSPQRFPAVFQFLQVIFPTELLHLG